MPEKKKKNTGHLSKDVFVFKSIVRFCYWALLQTNMFCVCVCLFQWYMWICGFDIMSKKLFGWHLLPISASVFIVHHIMSTSFLNLLTAAPPPQVSLHCATNGQLRCCFSLCVSPDSALWAAAISRLTLSKMRAKDPPYDLWRSSSRGASGPFPLALAHWLWWLRHWSRIRLFCLYSRTMEGEARRLTIWAVWSA